MSSFRQTFDVLKEAAGSYVNGIWVAGARTTGTILASIQPVVEQDLITAPEGRRMTDMIKVYTETDLQIGEEAFYLQPDIIVWRGYCYEITSQSVRQMNVINHYKYYATKRMAAPSNYLTAWVNGTLNRGNS